MNFLDLFSGIGGFRLGMTMAGHTPVGWVEWDKYARKSYEAIYEPKGEWTAHDITTVTNDDIRLLRDRGPIHVITAGFPCQAFSVAGKRGGFNDTRGTLFFEIIRFANILRPQYLFLENVTGLLNHDGGDTFETILRTLDEVGYDAEWEVLNSKDFGVPQNRERVFIIGHLRGGRTRKVFPIIGENGGTPKEFSSGEGIAYCLDANYSKGTSEGNIGKGRRTHVIEPFAVLTPGREDKRQNGRRFKAPGEPMFTLTAQDRHGVLVNQKTGVREVEISNCLDANYYKGLGNNQERIGVQENYRIRRLTPRECWRLQGFPDWAFDRAKYYTKEESEKIIKQQGKRHNRRNIPLDKRIERMSDSQLYKQAGNSVTVNVIYEIAKKLRLEE